MKTDDSILEALLPDTQLRERRTGHVLHSRSDPTGSSQPLQHLDTQSARTGTTPAGNGNEPHGQELHSRPGANHSQCFRGALEKGRGTRGRVCSLVRMPEVEPWEVEYNNHKVIAGQKKFP